MRGKAGWGGTSLDRERSGERDVHAGSKVSMSMER